MSRFGRVTGFAMRAHRRSTHHAWWRGAPWILCLCCGCGGGSDPLSESTGTRPAPFQEQVLRVEEPPAAPLPTFELAGCRVYSESPGWSVFVDGYPVRRESGAILTTPCAVQASAGSHTVTVARAGFVDQSRQLLFGNNAEVQFSAGVSGDSLLLGSPYLDLPVDRPVALHSLNSPGNEFDPFVTPDGLAIYFAGDRSEGQGIFVATRPTPLHPFAEPRLLRLTSSSDAAASPSVDETGLTIVYTLPAKGRIRALSRTSPLTDFEEPRILLSDEDEQARYPAAQIIAGNRIYFSRDAKGLTETRVAFAQKSEREPFGGVRIVQFPGEHPRLSPDGRRQYLFDGKTLRRSRRTTDNLPFLGTEEVRSVDLPKYVPSTVHRQFCVSNDEQWLFYSDDPAGQGDLWMVRLALGPAWGAPLSGTTIDPPQMAKAPLTQEPELFTPSPPMPQEPQAPPPPDPRSQPLPYVQFRSDLLEAVRRRDFSRALELIEQAQGDPQLADSAELIEWDRLDLQQLILFWQEVESAIRQLMPGARLRFGAVTVEFEGFSDGVLRARARNTTVQKSLRELDAGSILSLLDESLSQDDPRPKLRAAKFLTYAGDGTSSRLRTLLAESGPLGVEFREQLAAREAAISQWELKRENISAALQRIAELEREFPETAVAASAETLRDELYARTDWQVVGKRKWTKGPLGEWTASDERTEGALLVSPGELERFELTLEYRINSTIGNGGVYFRYAGRGRLDNNALKVQFSNDAGQGVHQYSTGSLFAVVEPRLNASRPQGEWNKFRMTVMESQVRVWINDKQVLATSFPTSGLPPAGYVALDGVRGGISYRKIILSDQPLAEE